MPCWYGYIFTKNASAKRLEETLRLELEGLSILYPLEDISKNDNSAGTVDITFNLPAGEDHIVILRRAQDTCQFALQFLTHAPKLTDEQLVLKAKEVEEKTQFADSQAYFKLYESQSPPGFVFYFQNDD